GVTGHCHLGADVLERLLHRPSIAHPVIDEADPRRAGHTSVPLVLGTPRSAGSIATATRNALANDLNTASITWWTFVPACTVRCSVTFAFDASARKNSSVSSWSKLPIEPCGSEASKTHSPRPETSIAHAARASSIGTVAAP